MGQEINQEAIHIKEEDVLDHKGGRGGEKRKYLKINLKAEATGLHVASEKKRVLFVVVLLQQIEVRSCH